MKPVKVTLDEIWVEMKTGKIYECPLKDKQPVFGLQDGTCVYIDASTSILETLIHELIHRSRPRMSEKMVDREARRLLREMDDATKTKWWRAYGRIKRKSRPVQV